MENKIFIAMLVAVCCIRFTQSSFFARRSILARQRPARVRTCDLRNLTNAGVRFGWAFPSNLSCDADVVVGLTSNNIVPEAAVGIRCTYTYSCNFDPARSRRSTVLACSKTGQWEGKMPDCSEDAKIAQSIIEIYADESYEENALEGERVNSTEDNSEENALDLSLSELHVENVRKSGNKTSNNTMDSESKLRELCSTEEMCKQLRHKGECKKVVPKTVPKFRIKRWLCRFCYRSFCTSSLGLL